MLFPTNANNVVSEVIKIKRVYDPPSEEDGFRILVDKLWPRGVSKEKANVDLWLREIAPSDDLRKWFSHDPKKWEEFKRKYERELKDKQNCFIKSNKQKKKKEPLLFSIQQKMKNTTMQLP